MVAPELPDCPKCHGNQWEKYGPERNGAQWYCCNGCTLCVLIRDGEIVARGR